MRPHDTSPEAHELQVRLYRSMTDEQRSELALRMSDDLRQIAVEGIRKRHPEYSDTEVKRALVALFYGADAVGNVWPGSPVPPP